MEVDQEVLSNVKDEDDFTYIELPCKHKWRAKKATHLKEIQNESFLVDGDEVLDETLEQQEVKNEPKPKELLNLSLRKKKDKFSGTHGERAERFQTAKNIKIAAIPNASVENVEEMLDLPKEPIVISDTEADENKFLEQHPVKVLANDELELIKNN